MWWIIGIGVTVYCFTRANPNGFVKIAGWVALVLLLIALAKEMGLMPFLVVLGVLVLLIAGDTLGPISYRPSNRLPAAKTPVSLPALRQDRETIAVGLKEIGKLRFFDPNTPEASNAWDAKDLDRIEILLKAGDELNRTSWQSAFDTLNQATKLVDRGRCTLIETIESAKSSLKPFGVAVNTAATQRSKVSHGYAPEIDLRRNFASRLNIAGGVGQGVGRIASGNVPWQVALPVLAFAFIAKEIGRSKMLRQFKETEGVLSTQATAMRGDVELMQNLFRTRFIPQFDVILRSIEVIRSAHEKLISNGNAAPAGAIVGATEEAVRLSITVAEAQHALQTMAGD